MNFYLFFILAFSPNADTTNQLPEHYHLFTYSTYELCVEAREKSVLEYPTSGIPYKLEFTLCQKVEREGLKI